MEDHHDRGLTLHLSWTSGARKRVVSAPLGAPLRAAAVVVLCALCYLAGARRTGLEEKAVAVQSPSAAVKVEVPALIEESQGPIITPLNALDPSALVMGPSAGSVSQPPPPAPPQPVLHWRQDLPRPPSK